MGKFQKKPVTVDAEQWFENGDHSQDKCGDFKLDGMEPFKGEGKVVRYYRVPNSERICQHCRTAMHDHGWIDTLEGGHIVCPGDWVITGIKGERYPCKPDVFKDSYRSMEGIIITSHETEEILQNLAKIDLTDNKPPAAYRYE